MFLTLGLCWRKGEKRNRQGNLSPHNFYSLTCEGQQAMNSKYMTCTKLIGYFKLCKFIYPGKYYGEVF